MAAATFAAPPSTAATIDPDTRVVIRTYASTTLPGDRASALAADELALRLVRLPPLQGQPDHVALGYSLVDMRLGAGSLATIYVDRVAALAGAWHLDVRTLLGRAVAHEIGHLLLGTANHARVGLMRAVWSQDALRREQPGDWVFTPRDAQTMRDAVRARNARQLSGHARRGD